MNRLFGCSISMDGYVNSIMMSIVFLGDMCIMSEISSDIIVEM